MRKVDGLSNKNVRSTQKVSTKTEIFTVNSNNKIDVLTLDPVSLKLKVSVAACMISSFGT